MRFKKDDKVRYIETRLHAHDFFHAGDIGVVTKDQGDSDNLWVMIGASSGVGDGSWNDRASYYELVNKKSEQVVKAPEGHIIADVIYTPNGRSITVVFEKVNPVVGLWYQAPNKSWGKCLRVNHETGKVSLKSIGGPIICTNINTVVEIEPFDSRFNIKSEFMPK